MKKVASFFLFPLCCIVTANSLFVANAQEENSTQLQTSISMDVYKKIREGSMQVETAYMEKKLEGIGAQLNGSTCPRATKDCFDETKNFTVRDINLILSNQVKTLTPYFAEDFKKTITAGELSSLMHDTRAFFKTFVQESKDDIRGVEQVGSIGVYTDGSLGNSPFDLVYDLEQIKGVILTNKKKYGGLKNTTAEEFTNSIRGGTTPKR